MSVVSASFSCRGHEKRIGVATTAADDASSKAAMMQAMLTMQTMILQRQQHSEDDLGCNLTIQRSGGNEKKRCLQAIFGTYSSGAPSLRRARAIQDDTAGSRVGSVEPPRTPSMDTQGSRVGSVEAPRTPSMNPQIALERTPSAASLLELMDADRPPPPLPPPLAPPVPPALPHPLALALPAPQTTPQSPIRAPQTQPEEEAVVPEVYTPQGNAKHAADMFDAFLARTSEKAELKKKEAAEKRWIEKQARALAAKAAAQAAKYEAVAMKVANKQAITDEEIAALKPAKEPEKEPAEPAKIKDASAEVASGCTKLSINHPQRVQRGISHEKSREQFLVRVPGFKSRAFIYKKTHWNAYASFQQAKDAAEAFFQSNAT